jgi:hypothetical protein
MAAADVYLSSQARECFNELVQQGEKYFDLHPQDISELFIKDRTCDMTPLRLISEFRIIDEFYGFHLKWVPEDIASVLADDKKSSDDILREVHKVSDLDIIKFIESAVSPKMNKSASTFAEAARKHEFAVQNMIAYIKEQKGSDITDKKITPEQIHALAETLSRVPNEKFETYKKKFSATDIDNIYLWAIANSTIVYPYLSLTDAANHIKKVVERAESLKSWGIGSDGRIHLPPLESVADSKFWYLLYAILDNKYGKEIVYDGTIDESFQTFSNDELAKNPRAGDLLFRLMELIRTTGSANFRTPDSVTSEIMLKNQVDLELIDIIRTQKDSLYKNYTLNPRAVADMRRSVTSNKTVSTGKKSHVVQVVTYEGSKLAETICSYGNYKSSTPESNPLYRIIHRVLEDLSKELPENWVIPKSVFLAPSVQVRTSIRQGPKIKTKGGREKANAYIPFSFVKSSSCTAYPAVAKKELTDIGSAIIKNSDLINSVGLREGGKLIPLFSDYISNSYIISDQLRKMWAVQAKIPADIPSIRESLVDNFSNIINNSKEVVEDLRALLKEQKALSDEIVFKDPLKTKEEMDALKASITKAENDKKDARKKRQTSNQ